MKTMIPPPTSHDVASAFKDAKIMRAQYLEAHGWEKSDDFPDNKLRWVKKFNGRELPLSAGGAFAHCGNNSAVFLQFTPKLRRNFTGNEPFLKRVTQHTEPA